MLFRVVAFDYLYTSISNLCKLDGSHYESRVSFVYKPAFFSLTRLALASVLGPFGVHLLTFTIDALINALLLRCRNRATQIKTLDEI